jgi:hypothetical protein
MRALLVISTLLLATPAPGEEHQAMGEVDAVVGDTVLLEQGQILEVKVELLRDGAPVAVEALRPGDEVRAFYDPDGTLTRLEASSAEPPESPRFR